MTHHKEVPNKKRPLITLAHVRLRGRAKFDERYRCHDCGPLDYRPGADDEKCRRCGSRSLDYDHTATIVARSREGSEVKLLVRESDAAEFILDLDRVLRTVFRAQIVPLDPNQGGPFHDCLRLCDADVVS